MRALVVLAHPLGDSLNASLARSVCDKLGPGSETTFVDLYAEGFDPRLSPEERGSYYAATHDIGGIENHATALRSAELIVLVFPTWWFGPPAILKGWIDRVFAPGIAFDHGVNFGPIVPLLTELRHAVVVTTLGTPWWVDRLVLHRPVRRIFKTAILGGCAPNAKLHYLPFYAAERAEARRIERFRARIHHLLAQISPARQQP